MDKSSLALLETPNAGEVGKNCGFNQSILLSLSTTKNMSICQDGSHHCGYWLLLDQTGQCFVSQPCTGWAQLNKRWKWHQTRFT